MSITVAPSLADIVDRNSTISYSRIYGQDNILFDQTTAANGSITPVAPSLQKGSDGNTLQKISSLQRHCEKLQKLGPASEATNLLPRFPTALGYAPTK